MTVPVHPEEHAQEHAHLEISRREVIVGLAVLAACSDDAGSGGSSASLDVKSPYPTWTTTLSNDYWRKQPDGTQSRYVTSNAGTTTVAGKTVQRFRMQRQSGDGSRNAELLIAADGTKITVAGGSYTSDTASSLGILASGAVTLDEPITVDLGAAPGTKQSVTLKGKATIGSSTTSVTAKGTYTVVDQDVSVETPAGTVSGCTHVRLEGAVPIVFGTAEVAASGEVWYSPALGVVKAQFDEPLAGFGVGVNGSRGWHDLGNGYASVEAVGVVGNGQTRFELSSSEAPDEADKTVHAKMLIELRWADDATAKTSQRPGVVEEFGTWAGYFPSTLVQSSVSLLHPDENGKGYVYWIGYVDQAAKNEAGSDATRYHTKVTADASLSPVRVSSRIIFKRYSAASSPV